MVVRNWMNRVTTEDAQAELRASVLFGSWKEWCMENNEYAGSQKVFKQKLMDMGTPYRHQTRARYLGQSRRCLRAARKACIPPFLTGSDG